MPKRTDIEKILIIGSGPIVIGQAAEFDYSGTQALKALKRAGYRLVVVNSNSATIMTDPELSDAVYIEPLTVEFLEAIIAKERPEALLPTLGGQTALNLAVALAESGVLDRYGVELIGALFETIRRAEDRELFKETMLSISLDVPRSQQVGSLHEAFAVAEELGYPLLIRPSYILGGRAVEIVDTPEELRHYVAEAARISPGYPVLVDRFLDHALEIDVDILTDGQNVWVAGLMEQIEEAGVHSGDSACVLPPVSLSEDMVGRIEDAVVRLVRAMGAVGLLNIQMAIKGNELFVLEANPRASRTVPFVSKAIGVPVAKLAAKVLVGKSLRELLAPYWPFPVHPGSPYHNGNLEEILDATHRVPTLWPEHSSVKEVALPFGRFPGCDVLLGPEMRSTGEVMSFGASFPEAFAKAQVAAGNPIPTEGTVLVSLADPDKREGIALVAQLYDWGFDMVATQGTARVLQAMGIPAGVVLKVGEGRPDVVDLIAQGKVNLVANTPSSGQGGHRRSAPPLPVTAEKRGLPLLLEGKRTVGYRIRAAALDYHVPYVTTLVALRAAVAAIRSLRSGHLPIRALNGITGSPLKA